MINRVARFAILVGVMLFLQPLYATKTIIIDLHGVLFGNKTIATLREVGVTNMVRYVLTPSKSKATIASRIRMNFYNTLDRVALLHFPEKLQNAPIERIDSEEPLPYLMRAWFEGDMTNSEICSMVTSAISEHGEWFNHHFEQQLFLNLSRMVFTPERFIASRKIYSEGMEFIKACKSQGYKIFVLSNWDNESIKLLEEKYPKLFKLIDGVVASGAIHESKPSLTAFKIVLDLYGLEPEDCVFIDDQSENVASANHIGINGFICPHKKHRGTPNFRPIAEKLGIKLK